MKHRNLVVVFFSCLLLSSCFSHRYNVGEGLRVEQVTEVTQKNHFLIAGLVPIKRAKIETMVGDTINYQVYTRMTPQDIIVSTLTIGVYTPTTTTVRIPAEKFGRNTNRGVRRRSQ